MSQQSLPPEVITEILHRLPAKSVGRFRCVSKGWLSLLTDPQFIKTHTENPLRQHHLIFEFKIQSDVERSFNLYSHPFNEKVVTGAKFSPQLSFIGEITCSGSCDGLVLVCLKIDEWPFTILLVNLTTREILQLPDDYYDEFDAETDDVEDLSCEFLYGFGYDSMTDDYKVVSVIYYEDDHDDNVEGVYVYVYSLKSKTWRRVIKIHSPYYNFSSNGVFVNGHIYWIITKDRLCAIAAFCLADETYSEVPFPKSCNLTFVFDCQLVVLSGKLALFLQDKGVIWLMNEHGVRESWTKILFRGINKIPIFKPEKGYRKPPLVMEDNAKFLVANNDRMMVYEIEKETFSETVCVWNPKNLSAIGSYAESLVSLKLNITEQKSPNSSEEKEEKDAEDEDVENEDLEDEDVEGAAEDEGKKYDQDTCKAISLDNFETIRQSLQATGHVVDTLSKDIKEKNVMILDLEKKVSQDYDSWKAKHQEEKLRADRLEGELNHALSKQSKNEATIQSNLAEIQALVKKNEELLERIRALDTADAKIESLNAKLAIADHERRKAIAALQSW